MGFDILTPPDILSMECHEFTGVTFPVSRNVNFCLQFVASGKESNDAQKASTFNLATSVLARSRSFTKSR